VYLQQAEIARLERVRPSFVCAKAVPCSDNDWLVFQQCRVTQIVFLKTNKQTKNKCIARNQHNCRSGFFLDYKQHSIDLDWRQNQLPVAEPSVEPLCSMISTTVLRCIRKHRRFDFNYQQCTRCSATFSDFDNSLIKSQQSCNGPTQGVVIRDYRQS
jgi:hypothetical protein